MVSQFLNSHAIPSSMVWGLLFFFHFISLSDAAVKAISESIELYHGYGSVFLKQEKQGTGLYVFDDPRVQIRFMTTFNYSYGNPFMIMDTQNQDILYRKISDDSGDQFVTFWKIGNQDHFFEFDQPEKAITVRSHCPVVNGTKPVVVRTRFRGQDLDGHQVEIEETHPQPHAACGRDRFEFVIRWISKNIASEMVENLEKELKDSLLRLFNVKSGDYEIHTEILR